MKIIENVFIIIGAIVLVGGLVAGLMAVPVWLLWNWVAVTVLNLPHITLLQAFGLNLLSAFLLRSYSYSSSSSSSK